MSDSGAGLWSVRGVPEDVRKLASDAAKAQAIPIGQWVSYAIRHTASDKGAMVGEVVASDSVSDKPPARVSDRPSDSREVVAILAAGLSQIAGIKGCGGTAARMRAVMEQHLAELALAPLPGRARPPSRQLTLDTEAHP